jgi:tight adherence protein B
MPVSLTVTWLYAIGVTAVLYCIFLSLVFRKIRIRRQINQRWKQYSERPYNKWSKNGMEDQRKRSIRLESKFKNYLRKISTSFQELERVFYRSGASSHIKENIIGQITGILVMLAVFLLFFKCSLPQSLCLSAFIASLLHFMILKWKEAQWKKSFLSNFSATLDIINRGLKSGLTLGRGIAMVAEEAEEPIATEFNYIAAQLQLGVDPDLALGQAALRIGIDEFRFFTLALIIQREMGGSLSEILGKLSELIRERERFRNKVWSLSAEGRATAAIVGGLPVVLGFILELISPGYAMFFLKDPRGMIMLWISCGLTLIGIIVIIRMMRVEA